MANGDEPVSAAIIDAYYTRSVGAGDLARGRAQAAQAACSGLGVIVLAYLTATSERTSWPALTAFTVSALAWAAAAILFAFAVGAERPAPGSPATSAHDFVQAVIASVRLDQHHVARWQRAAVITSAVGWMAVIAGVILTITHEDSAESFFVMEPTTDQATLLRSVCGWSGGEVYGTVSAESVESAAPELAISPQICAGKNFSFNPTPEQWANTLVDSDD